MPQLRIDPLTARRVIVAESRAGRPNDFAGAELSPVEQNTAAHAECPFCPGNESQTPHEKQQICDEQGKWVVRVVPNRFPAVEIDAPVAHAKGATGSASDIVKTSTALAEPVAPSAHGLHEVIIESPDHVSRVSQVSAAHWHRVLQTHVDRIANAANFASLQYALLFKNVGASGGASLSHLHSQFLALPEIPASMQTELAALRNYHESHDRCGWCDRIAVERKSERFIAECDGLIAFCPAVARQPFETWIMPVDHAADFRSLLTSATGSDSGKLGNSTALAEPVAHRFSRASEFIHDILCRVERAIGLAGYNVIVQTSPLRGVDPLHFHWRMEILPRVTPLAGLELATGTHICSLAPERAAEIVGRGQ